MFRAFRGGEFFEAGRVKMNSVPFKVLKTLFLLKLRMDGPNVFQSQIFENWCNATRARNTVHKNDCTSDVFCKEVVEVNVLHEE